jgi:uroporphyrinogen-III synthase
MKKVWLAREKRNPDPWGEVLQAQGWKVGYIPLIGVASISPNQENQVCLNALEKFEWVLFSSPMAVRRFFEEGGLISADHEVGVIGAASAQALAKCHVSVDLISVGGTGTALAEELLEIKNSVKHNECTGNILCVGAQGGQPDPARRLIQAGMEVQKLELHLAEEISGVAPPQQETILLFSPSAARSLAKRVTNPKLYPIWAIGPTTAKEAQSLGFTVMKVLATPEPKSLLSLIS